jgi:hypothetical protein
MRIRSKQRRRREVEDEQSERRLKALRLWKIGVVAWEGLTRLGLGGGCEGNCSDGLVMRWRAFDGEEY